jgi:hypothetical protein
VPFSFGLQAKRRLILFSFNDEGDSAERHLARRVYKDDDQRIAYWPGNNQGKKERGSFIAVHT